MYGQATPRASHPPGQPYLGSSLHPHDGPTWDPPYSSLHPMGQLYLGSSLNPPDDPTWNLSSSPQNGHKPRAPTSSEPSMQLVILHNTYPDLKLGTRPEFLMWVYDCVSTLETSKAATRHQQARLPQDQTCLCLCP